MCTPVYVFPGILQKRDMANSGAQLSMLSFPHPAHRVEQIAGQKRTTITICINHTAASAQGEEHARPGQSISFSDDHSALLFYIIGCSHELAECRTGSSWNVACPDYLLQKKKSAILKIKTATYDEQSPARYGRNSKFCPYLVATVVSKFLFQLRTPKLANKTLTLHPAQTRTPTEMIGNECAWLDFSFLSNLAVTLQKADLAKQHCLCKSAGQIICVFPSCILATHLRSGPKPTAAPSSQLGSDLLLGCEHALMEPCAGQCA